MHCACEGSVLLVGEGDFSMTLALLSCERGLKPGQVVATTMETEESISKHRSAGDNIKLLKDKGATVVYGVDGRDLQNCSALRGAQYTRIIFNFPHSGGKSDLKRNRALLNEFFQSSVQVLEEGGDVMVTLCRGQGGTPADVPRRAWSDSWQVQAMAANAGLILTRVLPFLASQYPQYSCTGFRSQDKGFHTEGALTHVFQTAQVVSSSFGLPPLSTPLQLPGGPCTCPSYLVPYLERSLLKEDLSPLKLVAQELERKLTSDPDCRQLPPPSSPLSPHPLTSPPHPDLPVEVALAPPEAPDCSKSSPDPPEEEKQSPLLRGSMLDCLPDCLAALQGSGGGTKRVVISGPVHSRCLVSPSRLPVRHQTLVVSHRPDIATAVCAACSELLGRPCRLEAVPGSLGSPDHGEEHASVKVPEYGTLCEDQVILVSPAEAGDSDVRVGSVWSRKESKSEKTSGLFAVVLDLDLLTQLAFDLPDPRLLWSSDPRCREQFKAGLGAKFEPFSLHPLRYEFDTSFWENPGRDFEELVFHELLQMVAGDVLTSVKLIDKYSDGERHSRCYRLTFTSHDKALPYITAWKLQSSMRLLVAREMGVQLR